MFQIHLFIMIDIELCFSLPPCVFVASSLSKGDPSAFLPIVDFSLTTFSPLLTAQLITAEFELTGKTDLRFTDTVYKVPSAIVFFRTFRRLSFICFTSFQVSATIDKAKLETWHNITHNEPTEDPIKPLGSSALFKVFQNNLGHFLLFIEIIKYILSHIRQLYLIPVLKVQNLTCNIMSYVNRCNIKTSSN